MPNSSGLPGVPPPDVMYIFPRASTPPHPFPWTVLRSYSATIAIGVAVLSTTSIPPPRRVTNVNVLVESTTGQIGALSGRIAAPCQDAPLGVVHVARFR